MTCQNGLITNHCVKELPQISDQIIDFSLFQIESTTQYFTTEAFKLVLNIGLWLTVNLE